MGVKDEVNTLETDAETEVETGVADAENEVLATDTAVDAWFVRFFHGSKIAAETDLYNLCHGAKEELKKILAKL